jgi:peroxiredoxin
VSHSPLTASFNSDNFAAYVSAATKLNEMVLAGMSFSGRERNCAYLNLGDASERFANVSAVSGLDFPDDGRGMGSLDWDFDGDLDLWISNRTAPRLRLMRNDTPADRHFIAVRLTGDGQTVSRDAIGARVTLTTDDVTLIRTLRAGEGYLSQSSKWLHFGLGEHDRVDTLTIRWPDGATQTFKDIDADRWYTLALDDDALAVWTPPKRDFAPREQSFEPQPDSQKARLTLGSRLPLPALVYRRFDGDSVRVQDHLDKPTLVNLWAVWCAPCQVELADLRDNYKQLTDQGVNVIALSVDGLGGDNRTTPADAQQHADRMGLPFETAAATEELVDLLQIYHDTLFTNRRPLPIPTSFLINTHGEVVAIYKGPISVDQIIEDAHQPEGDAAARRAHVLPFTGRWLSRAPQAQRANMVMALTRRGQLAHALGYLTTFATDRDEPARFDAMQLLAFELKEAGQTQLADNLLEAVTGEMRAAGMLNTRNLAQPPSTLPPGPMSPGGGGYTPGP